MAAKHEKHKELFKNLLKDATHPLKDLKELKNKLGGGVVVHAVNKVDPAFITMRAAVIGILELNVVGISSAYSLVEKAKNPQHWNDMLQKWWMAGGEKDHFIKAIDKGKVKKHLFEKLFDDFEKKKKKNLESAEPAMGAPANAGKAIAKAGSAISVIGGLIAAAGGENPAGGEAQDLVGGYVSAAGAIIAGLGASAAKSAKEQGANDEDIKGMAQGNMPADAPVPTNAAQIDKVNAAIDSTSDDDTKQADRNLVREQKINAGTYTQADKKADEQADKMHADKLRKQVSKHGFMAFLQRILGTNQSISNQ